MRAQRAQRGRAHGAIGLWIAHERQQGGLGFRGQYEGRNQRQPGELDFLGGIVQQTRRERGRHTRGGAGLTARGEFAPDTQDAVAAERLIPLRERFDRVEPDLEIGGRFGGDAGERLRGGGGAEAVVGIDHAPSKGNRLARELSRGEIRKRGLDRLIVNRARRFERELGIPVVQKYGGLGPMETAQGEQHHGAHGVGLIADFGGQRGDVARRGEGDDDGVAHIRIGVGVRRGEREQRGHRFGELQACRFPAPRRSARAARGPAAARGG